MTSASKAVPRKAGSAENRKSIARYSSQEVLGQFLALYSDMDFKGELEALGLHRISSSRRSRFQREFQGLSIALWRLALLQSFPDEAELFFHELMEKSPLMHTTDSSGEEMRHRVSQYVELLEDKKEKDLLPAAEYLADVMAVDEEDVHRLRLKLSLVIRQLYTRIFQKLV